MTIVHLSLIPEGIQIKDTTALLLRLQKIHPKLLILATNVLIEKMSQEIRLFPKDLLQPILTAKETLGDMPHTTKKTALLSCIPDTYSCREKQQAECYIYTSIGYLPSAINLMLLVYTSIKTDVDDVVKTVRKVSQRRDPTSRKLYTNLSKTMAKSYALLFESLREAEQQLLEKPEGDT